MPLQRVLVAPFDLWAVPKLRALADARATDIAGTRPNSNFRQLLRRCMAEYETQPFAHPAGLPGSNPDSVVITTDILRESAESFFWYHTHPGRLTLLVAYEANSGAHGTLLHAVTALELWASANVSRICELTCLELGIPAVDDASQLPDSFHEQRNVVVRREFDQLSVAEQTDWHELAREITVAMAQGEIAACAIQSRQESVSLWMQDTIEDKLAASGIGGSMVISWQGFYVGKEDKRLHEFQGHTSTAGDASWFDSPAYLEHVDSWHNFVDDEVYDLVICSLAQLPYTLCAASIPDYQLRLKSFLEELFRLQCGLEELDGPTFWARVRAYPNQFVAPHRLPDGTVFADPFRMNHTDFRVLYTHVWRAHTDRRAMGSSSRFIFEPKMVGEYIALDKAEQLKAMWDQKKSDVATTTTHASAADDLIIDMVDAELRTPTTADSTHVINRASQAAVLAVDSPHVPYLRSLAGVPLELAAAPTPYKGTAKRSGNELEGGLAKTARLLSDEDSTARRVSGTGVA